MLEKLLGHVGPALASSGNCHLWRTAWRRYSSAANGARHERTLFHRIGDLAVVVADAAEVTGSGLGEGGDVLLLGALLSAACSRWRNRHRS